MFLRHAMTVLGAAALIATPAAGQATGTASFNAPYRAFEKYEFGGTVSFNEGDATGLEGQLRLGYKAFDIGFRGGMLFTDATDDIILLGAEGRGRVLTHSEQFPLDGAIVAGLGFLFNGGTIGNVPLGLSLGRRIDLENSEISLVPYVQPTGNFVFGEGTEEFGFSLGFGLDARLSKFFDARVSAGFGTDWGIEGFAISALWIR